MIILIATSLYYIGSIFNVGYLSALILIKIINFNVSFNKIVLTMCLAYACTLFFRTNPEDSLISILLLIPLFLIGGVKKIDLKRNIYLNISIIYMSFCLIFFKNDYQILFIDKNIFMIPFVPLILYYAYNLSIKSGLIAFLCYLSGSRLSLYIFILTMVFGVVLNNIKRKPILNFLMIILGLIMTSIILISISISIDITEERSIFDIIDASNLERANALLNAISYLKENIKVLLIGGGWADYSNIFNTRVHNDFIQLIIKNGIFYLILFIIGISRLFYILKVPTVVIFSLTVYSSLLGGIAWLGGLFWIFPLAVLFTSNRNLLLKNNYL